MPSAAIQRLVRLAIHEVSGVDDPANEAPGWIVLKRRGAAFRARLLKRAAGEPQFGFFAVANRETGEVTTFTAEHGTAADEMYAAMSVAGFDPHTIAAFGGTPTSIKNALRKMQPSGGTNEIPQGAGDSDPPPGPATGRQPTGNSQQGMPTHQARDGSGRYR